MSIAPEAFEWLRGLAYAQWGSVTKAERNLAAIATWGEVELRRWRDERPDGSDLTDAQLRTTAKGIARFMVEKFGERRKRQPSKSTFESRALRRHTLRVVADMMAEDRGVETVSARRVADVLGNSRSTTARALAAVRGKPRRDAVAAKLSPNSAKLLSIVESILPGDGERCVRVADLVERMWPRAGADVKPGTARAQRKRLLDTIETLAPLSIYARADGDLVALIRGRRWTDGAAAARLKAGVSNPARKVAPVPAPVNAGPFWSSPEARCLVAMLRAAGGRNLLGHSFSDFVSLQTTLRDKRPLVSAYGIAVRHGKGGGGEFSDFVRYVLSDKPRHGPWRFEPAAREALITAADHMDWLYEDGRWGRPAVEAVDYARREFARLRDPVTPESGYRIEAFRVFIDKLDDRGDAIEHGAAVLLCERLAQEEAAGTWSAEPLLQVLARF